MDRAGWYGLFVLVLLLGAGACTDSGIIRDADALREKGQYNEALTKYVEYLNRYPDSKEEGYLHQQVAHLEEWIQVEALRAQAEQHVGSKRFGDALKSYTLALSRGNRSEYPRIEEIRVRFQELMPQQRASLLAEAETALKGGEPRKAVNLYSDALRLTPPEQKDDLAGRIEQVVSLVTQLEQQQNTTDTVAQAQAIRDQQAKTAAEAAARPAPQRFDWASLFNVEEEAGAKKGPTLEVGGVVQNEDPKARLRELLKKMK